MKTFTIYSLKLANALTEKGFKCVGTSINIHKPGFKVFYFEDSEALQAAIAEIVGK